MRRAARRGRATENILFRKSSAIALVVEAKKHKPTDIETYSEVNGAKKRKSSCLGAHSPVLSKKREPMRVTSMKAELTSE